MSWVTRVFVCFMIHGCRCMLLRYVREQNDFKMRVCALRGGGPRMCGAAFTARACHCHVQWMHHDVPAVPALSHPTWCVYRSLVHSHGV